MNFLGLPVDDLDPERFFAAGKALYAFVYLIWAFLLFRGGNRGAWLLLLLALFPWFLTTYPLERLYGLETGLDRQRNVWWCATAAAGNAPWESGVLAAKNLEPAWAFFVASLALFDPSRVVPLYAFLPALAIVLVGLSFHRAFRAGADFGEGGGGRAELVALFVVFLLLLAPSPPLDYMSPFRAFWQRTFLLKPNHALGLALLPLVARELASARSRFRHVVAGLLLGALGWAFVVHWALASLGIVFYVVLLRMKRVEGWQREASRVAIVLVLSLIVVAPYLAYLVQNFPVVSFPTAAFPDDPERSVWGDRRSGTHSLFFLATLDLGPLFFLGLLGVIVTFLRGRRFELLWLGLTAGACAGWIANVALLFLGQARQSDEIYFFLVVLVAVEAAFGTEEVVERVGKSWDRRRAATAAVLLWFPLTLPWWWDPARMDTHFRLALEPLPGNVTALSDWLLRSSEGRDVVLAGTDSAMWIPALTGRRVLRTGKPEPGTEALENERRILFPSDPEDSRRTLERLGVRFVVADPALRAEHGIRPDELEGNALLERVHDVDGIEVYRVRD
jgi:hypothetical protein